MSIRASAAAHSRARTASAWILAHGHGHGQQRRYIRSHSRTVRESTQSADGEIDESENARDRGSRGSRWDGFVLSSPRQVLILLSLALWLLGCSVFWGRATKTSSMLYLLCLVLVSELAHSSCNTSTHTSSGRTARRKSSPSLCSTTIIEVRPVPLVSLGPLCCDF